MSKKFYIITRKGEEEGISCCLDVCMIYKTCTGRYTCTGTVQ